MQLSDYQFCVVFWTDICSGDDWESLENAKTTRPAECVTPGWLIAKHETHLVVASSLALTLDDVFHHVSIPIENVSHIEKISLDYDKILKTILRREKKKIRARKKAKARKAKKK